MQNFQFIKDGVLVLHIPIAEYQTSGGYPPPSFYDNTTEIDSAVVEYNTSQSTPNEGWLQSVDSQGNEIYIDPATIGSGVGTPVETILLDGTKTSGQNINGLQGVETDLTWDVVSQDNTELTGFGSGQARITFTNPGWINIHASAVISNSVMNNRAMILLSLYHYDSSDTLKYAYHGDMQYNRDDNDAYDSSGGCVNQGMMSVASGDYVYIRTRIFDDGTAATVQTLDTSYSRIRIAKINF